MVQYDKLRVLRDFPLHHARRITNGGSPWAVERKLDMASKDDRKGKSSNANDAIWRSRVASSRYKECTMPELRRFVRDRGIGVSPKPRRKLVLVEMLEEADMNVSFHRFLQLSAELREMVYQEYFAEYPAYKYPQYPVPIFDVSRQVREESQRVFFKTATFDIKFSLFLNPGGIEQRNANVIDNTTSRLLFSTSEYHVGLIQHITMTISVLKKATVLGTVEIRPIGYFVAAINLDSQTEPAARVEQLTPATLCARMLPDSLTERAARDIIDAQVLAIANELASKPESRRLGIDGLVALRDAFVIDVDKLEEEGRRVKDAGDNVDDDGS